MELKKKEFLLGWTGNEGTLRGPRGSKNIIKIVFVLMFTNLAQLCSQKNLQRQTKCRAEFHPKIPIQLDPAANFNSELVRFGSGEEEVTGLLQFNSKLRLTF